MSDTVKREVQFVLALVGAAAVLGSVAGAAWGYVTTLKCWCCIEQGEGEP